MMLSTDAGVPLWRAGRRRPGSAQISGCVRVRISEQDLATPRKTRRGQGGHKDSITVTTA